MTRARKRKWKWRGSREDDRDETKPFRKGENRRRDRRKDDGKRSLVRAQSK